MTAGPFLLFLLVLDLPGVVKSVPGGAAGDEPGRAPRPGEPVRRPGHRAGPDLREDRGADPGQGGGVTGRERPLLEPEHAGVEHLSLVHVLHDLVTVPAAAARAFAQHRRGRGGRPPPVVPPRPPPPPPPRPPPP